MRFSFRRTAVAVIASGLVVAGTGAAVAAPSVSVPGRSNTATGHFTGVLLDGGLEVVADCTAAATGDVVSQAITQCYLTTGGGNHPIALPGPGATSAFTALVPLKSLQLCWVAVATFTDTSTKPTWGCTNNVNLAGGGVSGLGESTTL